MSASALEYAPGAPLVRRRWVRRAILLVVVVGLLISGLRYGPRAWERGVLLYHQDRCLRYAAPADLVVYEAEEGAAVELLKREGYWPMGNRNGSGAPPVGAYVPAALRDLDRAIAPGNPGMRMAVLFMGELRAQNGERRLVVVQRAASNLLPLENVFDLVATVFEPATLRRDLRVVPPRDPMTVIWDGPLTIAPAKGLRFYAGQRVAGEADRFTIRYSMEGREGIVEGRLSDDGMDVDFEIKSGPAVGSVWAHPGARDR